jgi:hypothetical protein
LHLLIELANAPNGTLGSQTNGSHQDKLNLVYQQAGFIVAVLYINFPNAWGLSEMLFQEEAFMNISNVAWVDAVKPANGSVQIKKIAVFFIALLTLVSGNALAVDIKFSVDPASPAITGAVTPDDVLTAGPAVFTPGTALGLVDNVQTGMFDNLNALSYGQDPIQNPLFFSVDRVSVGLPGSAVNVRALPGVATAAKDVYVALPPVDSNSLFLDGARLGLAPGFFGDDLDGLELDTAPAPFTYFSIDFLSDSNAFGGGDLANDILISRGNGLFGIFAQHGVLGLQVGDDIDALVLDDRFEPGILNPGIDKALFSLTPFSSSTFTFSGAAYAPGVLGELSPADILFTDFTGDFSLWASAANIGLRPGDNVDALDTVPEPHSLFLLVIGLAGLLFSRRTTSVRFTGKANSV